MISISLFFSSLVFGLVVGTIYALMGLGLTLIFGILRIANFAHGEFYTLGAYLYYYILTIFGLPIYLAVPISAGCVFLIGILCERLLLRPMQVVERPVEYAVIITFMLRLIIVSSIILICGPFRKSPPVFPFTVWFLSGNELIAFTVSFVLILLVTLFIKKTQIGRNWRAMAEDLHSAAMVGVNIRKMSSLAFATAVALAAVAGAILSPVFLISPTAGAIPLLKGYVIIAIGGLGSISGSIVGGIALGVTEALGSVIISPAYKDVYGFMLMVSFLILKPTGLLGKE